MSLQSLLAHKEWLRQRGERGSVGQYSYLNNLMKDLILTSECRRLAAAMEGRCFVKVDKEVIGDLWVMVKSESFQKGSGTEAGSMVVSKTPDVIF